MKWIHFTEQVPEVGDEVWYLWHNGVYGGQCMELWATSHPGYYKIGTIIPVFGGEAGWLGDGEAEYWMPKTEQEPRPPLWKPINRKLLEMASVMQRRQREAFFLYTCGRSFEIWELIDCESLEEMLELQEFTGGMMPREQLHKSYLEDLEDYTNGWGDDEYTSDEREWDTKSEKEARIRETRRRVRATMKGLK